MIRLRRSEERGRFKNSWLDARFSFSFGGWRHPDYDGDSDLLVFNDDVVAPGRGFLEHGHDNVEVMSYPLSGAVEHRDSLGNRALMQPGDVHLMRAGTGIGHSEMNPSGTDPEHHLQWWITPAQRDLAPSYARIHVPDSEKRGQWKLIASPDGVAGSLAVAQDVRIYVSVIEAGRLVYRPQSGRRTFVHVTRGTVALGGDAIHAGDEVFVENELTLTFQAWPGAAGEVLLFDLR